MSREGVSLDDDDDVKDDEPYKLGLTGSIGTGKSTVAKKMLERTLGVPTYDADKVVHELYGENGSAVAPLRALFGEDVIDSKTDAVDRKRLGEKVVGHPDEMAKLEAIVHPLVEEKRKQFIEDFSKDRGRVGVRRAFVVRETVGEYRGWSFSRVVFVGNATRESDESNGARE